MLSRLVFLSTLAVLPLVALPTAARAQSFSFGISSGGGHHHHHGYHGHHHHCHPGYPWYGFSYYRPAPVVVYPAAPPVTYVYPSNPVVVQPVQTAVAPAPAASSVGSSPPRINSVPSGPRSDVTIRNPSDNGGPVAFVVGDQMDAELEAGSVRTWSGRTTLIIEFDRGGNFGAARKVLRPGAYDFVVTEEGWDLVSASASSQTAAKPSQLQRNPLPRR